MSLKLYQWQKECLQAWFQNHCHGIVNVVTGAGKTILALASIKELEARLTTPLRIKIIVPKTFMVAQWAASMLDHQLFLDLSRQEIGYYYGLHKDTSDCKYMIYVINSARYSLARHIKEDLNSGYCVLVIADECHHYASQENRKIFDFLTSSADQCQNYYSLGLSATPQNSEYETVLVPALGPEIYQYGFGEAIRQHVIRNYALFHVALDFSADERAAYEEISDSLSLSMMYLTAACPYLKKINSRHFFRILNCLAKDSTSPKIAAYAQSVLIQSYQRRGILYSASARIDCALKLIQNFPLRSKIIIFGERISQADLLFSRLNAVYPNQAGRYHSKMEAQAQKNTLERYRNGEIRILVCCRALDEGFNIPATHIGIVLSSASVKRQRIQRLGRILRQSHEKNIASLYYLYIEDSSEENLFFPEEVDAPHSLYLSYSAVTNRLSHPAYEESAEKVLRQFRQQGLDSTALSEAEKCLAKGLGLSDWLLDIETCRENIRQAEATEIKNYWICMQYMIQCGESS